MAVARDRPYHRRAYLYTPKRPEWTRCETQHAFRIHDKFHLFDSLSTPTKSIRLLRDRRLCTGSYDMSTSPHLHLALRKRCDGNLCFIRGNIRAPRETHARLPDPSTDMNQSMRKAPDGKIRKPNQSYLRFYSEPRPQCAAPDRHTKVTGILYRQFGL
jgi:hypothetical protein